MSAYKTESKLTYSQMFICTLLPHMTISPLLPQVDGLNSLHSVKSTPNRFTKTSQGRSWNTGNGSPDAICMTVDKPGAVLVSFCVYGGGGIPEYELAVLAADVRAIRVGLVLWRGCCAESPAEFFYV